MEVRKYKLCHLDYLKNLKLIETIKGELRTIYYLEKYCIDRSTIELTKDENIFFDLINKYEMLVGLLDNENRVIKIGCKKKLENDLVKRFSHINTFISRTHNGMRS